MIANMLDQSLRSCPYVLSYSLSTLCWHSCQIIYCHTLPSLSSKYRPFSDFRQIIQQPRILSFSNALGRLV